MGRHWGQNGLVRLGAVAIKNSAYALPRSQPKEDVTRREGKWVVVQDPTAPSGDHVLAQLDQDDTDYRFPVAVADAPRLKDLRLEVRCKSVSGKTDDVNLYHVVKGQRRQIKGWRGKVAP